MQTDSTLASDDRAEGPSLNARLVGMGMKKAYASHLATGKRTPSLDLALEIEARLGIAPRFWRDRPDLQGAGS